MDENHWWSTSHRGHLVVRQVGTDDVTGFQAHALCCLECAEWYFYDFVPPTPEAPR